MTPLTPAAAVMDEQRLQEIEQRMRDGKLWGSDWADLIAEVRRLQQQSQEMAHELTQTARASQHFEQQVTALIAERDAALTEARLLRRNRDALLARIESERIYVEQAGRDRDEARANAERFRQSMYATEESSANQYQRAERAAAAITEARRVLRKIEWVRIGGKMQPYCPFCWEQAKDGHTADCALAALLAQEEQP